MDYNFSADLLNKFSQLTPWVQAIIACGTIIVMIAPFYFLKEIVSVIAHRNQPHPKEWHDKYFRDPCEEPRA